MSVQSELVRLALRMSRMKERYGTEQGMRQFVAHKRRDHAPSMRIRRARQINDYAVEGHRVYHLCPRRQRPAKHVLYLHGGAYVAGILPPHWWFLDRLMDACACQTTVPLYGLAPEHDYLEAYSLIEHVYCRLLTQYAPEDILLMGDSAGGGLSLAFAQSLLDKDLPQPGGIVLLSPWLDITLSQPEAEAVVKRDPMLNIPGAREAGRLWAHGADPTTPLLSPLFGPVGQLAPTCLLIGTDDMLLPAARDFRERAQTQGQALVYREYPGMFHTWMLLPLPEARQALRDVVQFMAPVGSV